MPELTELHPAGHIPAGGIISEVIPEFILREVSDALVIGLTKHDAWEHGQSKEYYAGALIRHLHRWQQGETYDQEDGQHHLAAVVVRAFQLIGAEGRDETKIAGFGVC
jgi:hypothetical protein